MSNAHGRKSLSTVPDGRNFRAGWRGGASTPSETSVLASKAWRRTQHSPYHARTRRNSSVVGKHSIIEPSTRCVSAPDDSRSARYDELTGTTVTTERSRATRQPCHTTASPTTDAGRAGLLRHAAVTGAPVPYGWTVLRGPASLVNCRHARASSIAGQTWSRVLQLYTKFVTYSGTMKRVSLLQQMR